MAIESVQGQEPGSFPKPTRRLVGKKPKRVDKQAKQVKGMGERPAEMFPQKPRPLGGSADAQAPGRGWPERFGAINMEPYQRRENMMKLIAEREQHILATKNLNQEANIQRIRSQYGPMLQAGRGIAPDADYAGVSAALENIRGESARSGAEDRNIKHIRNLLRDPTEVSEESRIRQRALGAPQDARARLRVV